MDGETAVRLWEEYLKNQDEDIFLYEWEKEYLRSFVDQQNSWDQELKRIRFEQVRRAELNRLLCKSTTFCDYLSFHKGDI